MKYDLFTLASEDKFLAQAYADYFAKRTDYYTKFLAMVTEAVADTTLEDSEQALALVESDRQELIDVVTAKAEALGYDLSSLKGDSQAYINVVNTIAQDSEVQALINARYSSPELILANLNAYINRDFQPTVSDIDTGRAKFLSFANTPDLGCYSKRLSTLVSDRVQAICNEYGFNPEGYISLQAGYTQLKSVLSAAIEDGLNVRNDTALKISFKDIEENTIDTIFNRAYTVDSLFEEIKETIGAGVSTAAAFNSLQLDSVADRLQQFSAIVGTKITDTAANASAYIATLRSKISDARTKVGDFVGYFLENSGLSRILNHESVPDDGYVDAETGFSQITGANPMPLADFSSLTTVIGNGIKFCLLSIGKLFQKGWEALTDSAKRSEAKLYQTFENPYDIGETGSTAFSHLISQFVTRTTGTQSFSFRTTDDTGARFKEVMQSHNGNWLKYSSIFGEVMLKFDIHEITDNSVTVDYDFRFKPRPIYPGAFYSVVKSPDMLTKYCAEYSGHTVFGEGGSYKVNDTAHLAVTQKSDFELIDNNDVADNRLAFMTELIEKLRSVDKLYADCSDSESTLYRAFYLGSQLFGVMVSCATIEMMTSDTTGIIPALIKLVYAAAAMIDSGKMVEGCIQDTVTNLMFLQMATNRNDSNTAAGWPISSTYTRPASSSTSATITRSEEILTHLSIYMLMAFCSHFADEALNPLSFEFMPYTNNTTDFTEAQYYIKTDADNQEAATALMTGITAIIVIAVLTVAIGLTVRAIKLRRAAKLTTWIGQKDAAAWDGKTMSVLDMWKYNRKSRKLSKLQTAGSGIVGAASSSGLGSLATDPFYQRLLVSTVGGDAAVQKYLPSNDSSALSVLDEMQQGNSNVLSDTNQLKQSVRSNGDALADFQEVSQSADAEIYYQLTRKTLPTA